MYSYFCLVFFAISPFQCLEIGNSIAKENAASGDISGNTPFDVEIPFGEDCGSYRHSLKDILQNPEKGLYKEVGSYTGLEFEREESGESVKGVVVLRRSDEVEAKSYTENYRVCLGHSDSKKDTASSGTRANDQCKSWASRVRATLDPNVIPESIWFHHVLEKKKGGVGHYIYYFKCSHSVNAPNCTNHDGGTKTHFYQETTKTPWIATDPDLYSKLQETNALLLEKIIHSDNEHRLAFIRKGSSVAELALPEEHQWELISERCILEDAFGCLKWKRKYQSLSVEAIRKDLNIPEIEMAVDEEEDPEALSQSMALFSLMNQSGSLEDGFIFSGSSFECSESGFLDCCKDSGIIKSLYLNHCSENELELLDAKKLGLCVSVGEYTVSDSLGFKRRKRSYCKFSTKLSRVFQEEARKQLKVSWGTAENPNCRGLSMEEIQQIDFEKVDLSEAFSEINIHHEKSAKKINTFFDGYEERISNLESTFLEEFDV